MTVALQPNDNPPDSRSESTVARRIALGFLATASPLVLLAFLVGGPVAEVVFTILAMAFPVAFIVIGISGRRPMGPLTIPLLGLLLVWLIRRQSDKRARARYAAVLGTTGITGGAK